MTTQAEYMRQFRAARPDVRAKENAASRARSRALVRLRRLHEDEFIELVNEERRAEGLAPLFTTPVGRRRSW